MTGGSLGDRLPSDAGTATGRLVERQTRDLQPHPTYRALCASTLAVRVNRITKQPGPIREPLLVTTAGTILDGYARWQAALDRQQATVPCIEYEFTQEEALGAIIHHHRGASGLNAYCRIILALELEPTLKQLPAGGQSSNLTDGPRGDTRAAVAQLAGVSTGNVTKTKQLLASAIPEIREALVRGELRIHRAWQWRSLSPKAQRDSLWKHLNDRSMAREITRLVNSHVRRDREAPQQEDDCVDLIARRLGLSNAADVTVAVVAAPGKALVVTPALREQLLVDPAR